MSSSRGYIEISRRVMGICAIMRLHRARVLMKIGVEEVGLKSYKHNSWPVE